MLVITLLTNDLVSEFYSVSLCMQSEVKLSDKVIKRKWVKVPESPYWKYWNRILYLNHEHLFKKLNQNRDHNVSSDVMKNLFIEFDQLADVEPGTSDHPGPAQAPPQVVTDHAVAGTTVAVLAHSSPHLHLLKQQFPTVLCWWLCWKRRSSSGLNHCWGKVLFKTKAKGFRPVSFCMPVLMR